MPAMMAGFPKPAMVRWLFVAVVFVLCAGHAAATTKFAMLHSNILLDGTFNVGVMHMLRVAWLDAWCQQHRLPMALVMGRRRF